MEIADKPKVIILDGLNPQKAIAAAIPSPVAEAAPTTTALPLAFRNMRTATPAFESALQQHSLIDPATGSVLLDSSLLPEQQQQQEQHRFKRRLHKIIRIPPSVAQTHSRMTPIKLGFSRVERRKLPSVTVNSGTTTQTNSSSTKTTSAAAQSTGTATSTNTTRPQEENEKDSTTPVPGSTSTTLAAEAASEEADAAEKELHHHLNTNSNSSSSTKHGDEDDEDNEDENDVKGDPETTYPMAPREGFTVSYSLFAKVKARVLHQNNSSSIRKQNQLHPVTKKHPNEESGSSQEDGSVAAAASKGSNSDETEVASNASHSNPNTLSAGTSGHFNSINNILGSNDDTCHDSDSTATDLDDMSAAAAGTTRLRQRKYSFGSRHNSVGPDEYPNVGAVVAHAEVITELIAEEDGLVEHGDEIVIVGSDPATIDDKGQDPVELFERVLTRQHLTEEAIAASLHELRQLILAYGIPEQPTFKSKTPSIRGKCWKLLLEVHHVSAQEYVSLVKQGKPEEYGKIRNDTFRTLATDRKFTDVVEEDSLIRVLCAFAWSTQATSAQDSDVSFTYVQGMNVLAAPFLYTMSEMEAFYSYSNLIKYCCPLYVQPTLQGVHCGIKLLEECLSKIDRELYDYLKSKRLSAELYAFPSVLTICACTPPLDQAMQLWDFLLAWGIHLNIICIIAQLYLIRDELMSHASPMKLLRIFPDLDADKIIRETIRMVKLLPDELYDLLVRHPYDPTVAEQIGY